MIHVKGSLEIDQPFHHDLTLVLNVTKPLRIVSQPIIHKEC